MQLSATRESWPIAGSFVIAHGAKTTAEVVVVTITDGAHVGRGECTPYPRFGESVDGVIAQIEALPTPLDRAALLELLDPGGARCAVDSALWDLAAQREGKPVHELARLPPPAPMVTAFTLSVDTAEQMGARARIHAHRELLKVKLDGDLSACRDRLAAVHEAAPHARLIVDPNGSWTQRVYETLAPSLAGLGVVLLEQPFAEDDTPLAHDRPILVAADEACRRREHIPGLVDRYDVINVKLDKAGGLTSAIAWAETARSHGLGLMVGCHVCTSLSLAPALLLATTADFVDLDAGLLLERDREGGAIYDGSTVEPGSLWGRPAS